MAEEGRLEAGCELIHDSRREGTYFSQERVIM
jgi:hypothetical protein